MGKNKLLYPSLTLLLLLLLPTDASVSGKPQCPVLPGLSLEVSQGRIPRQPRLHQGTVGLCLCPGG
uniref:Alpha-2-macroglobulin variant 13 n=1 Tax=Bos taurus TaxID=9913 RepID=K4JF08_BOVIN|nr:alpha-2-macroglobulin variant 13 [Bos taurus]